MPVPFTILVSNCSATFMPFVQASRAYTAFLSEVVDSVTGCHLAVWINR